MSVETARFEQLEAITSVQMEGVPVRLHGSVGHAAMQGIELPSATKTFGTFRDIDVYHPSADKLTLETDLSTGQAGSPHPLDAGLCGLLRKDGGTYIASKDGVEVELAAPGIFDEYIPYEVIGTNGLMVYGFSRQAAFAIHQLEPRQRILHRRADNAFSKWLLQNETALPNELIHSIDAFHEAYRSRYPFASMYEHLSQVYVRVMPEVVRKRLRSQTHRFMERHAGRENPLK